MGIFKKFIKPSIVDENKFYVVDQIIRYAGKNRHYLLHGVSDGMFNLLRKSNWNIRRSEVVPSDITILFKDELSVIELNCESIDNLYSALDKARKEN